MSISPEMLAIIGTPEKPRAELTDAEIGWRMKMAARQAIDNGEIKNAADAKARFLTRGHWIVDADQLGEHWREYLLNFEQQFYLSALKYLRELGITK